MGIRELPEGVWTRIAAGEVVERPASAVKELVENSLDAGAHRVKVRLWDGGRLCIVVEDDGHGIAMSELPLALTPHATSKISGIEDLEAIQTLGYRGEALASLTAVADMEIRSRPENEPGGLIRASGGHITEHIAAGCSPGTRVQVDGLFNNFPARRKFLKSAAGELRRTASCLREYAVCRPDVAFLLEHDGREVFSTDGAGDRRRVLERLWGPGPEIQTASASSGHLGLECWYQAHAAGKSSVSPTARNDIMAFVNGRAVNDPLIKGAVNSAARELPGSWALFLTLDPSLVDVNIHPAKAEVRFQYPNEVFSAVRNAAAQLGGPTRLELNQDEADEAQRSFPVFGPAPTQTQTQAQRGHSPVSNFYDFPDFSKFSSFSDFSNARRTERPAWKEPVRSSSPSLFSGPAPSPSSNNSSYNIIKKESGEKEEQRQERQEENKGSEAAYMGQTSAGYLLFDTPDGLILMDPHAAHERVEYERVRKLADESGGTQNLLIPVLLSPSLAMEAGEYQDALRGAGLELEARDGGTYLCTMPAFLAGLTNQVPPEGLLRAFIAALKEEDGGDVRELLWRAWATMACRAAVKLTSELPREEAASLWKALHECRQPFFCPHGRPTILELKSGELSKHFGRE